MDDVRTAGGDHARAQRARRALRVLAVTAGLAALAAGSSGCVILREHSVSQPGLIGGKFRLDVGACVSNATPSCPSGGTSNIFPTPAPGTNLQVLGAVQLPTGYSLPEVIAKTDRPADPGARLTRSASYEAELTELLPPPAGKRWYGYISDPFSDYVRGATYFQGVDIVRAAAPEGEPMPALKEITYVAGGRLVTPEAPGSRPVVCDGDATVCVDSRLDRTGSFLHDLALTAPTTVTAERGATAVIPVAARFAGTAGPEYAFALTATTTLSGTSATPNVPTLTPPSDSTTSLSVSVPVPANAAPGSYPVTVTATVGGVGASASTTATIVVPAGAPPAAGTVRPSVSAAAVGGLTARTARLRGLPVRITTDTATSATITLSQTRRVRVGRRFVLRSVRVASRRVDIPVGTSTVRVRSAAFRPGRVAIRVTGGGFDARAAVGLR